MSLVCHDDPKDFYRAAVPLLARAEACNNLPLGLLLRLQQRPELVERALMLTLSEGDASLVGVQTRPGQLVLGETDWNPALLSELVTWMLLHRPRLQGLVAPRPLAEAFAKAWREQGGSAPRVEMEQRIYSLDHVTPLPRPDGHYRLAGLGDLNLLQDWIEAFIAEALPHERPDREGIRSTALHQIEAHDIGLWERGEHPVSMAARTRPTLSGTAVSLVYTPPDQRGKGYAGACVAELSQAQLNQGMAFCCLFTDLANPTSNQLYQRIGYEPVGDVLVLGFGAEA